MPPNVIANAASSSSDAANANANAAKTVRSKRIDRKVLAQRLQLRADAPKGVYPTTPIQALPADISMDDLFKILPKEVFEKSNLQAFGQLLFSLISCGIGIYLLTVLPWFLLPIGWAFVGTAATGLFIIGHDCGHNSFFPSDLANEIVGFLCHLTLIYPFASWKEQHNAHHNNVRNLQKDNSWKPVQVSQFHQYGAAKRILTRLIHGPFWNFGSIVHWFKFNFDPERFPLAARAKVLFNLNFLYLSSAVVFGTMYHYFGLWAIFKYWGMPWLVFHFWLSSLSLAQHAHPHIPFLQDGEWEEALSKVTLMPHMKMPAILELFFHNVNYTVPHYVSPTIPLYRLKKADQILRAKYGRYMTECNFGAQLIFYILSNCQLFDSEKNYRTFASVQESSVLEENISGVIPKVQGFRELLGRLNWLHIPILTIPPLLGIYGILYVPLQYKTFVWAYFYYVCTGLGITAGYHRLWAHRAYDASLPVRFFLCMFASGAVEGSIRWWCRDHRAHHRYTDTPKDPYSASEGFFYAHVGWMMLKQDPQKIGRHDISDLNQSALVRWQHRNYLAIALFMGFLFPTLVAGLGWGDYAGGFFFAGMVRLVLVHHATFFVNSLAHYLGEATYADEHTPRDSFITAILTFGEGYHNFHHEFPSDYRNGIRFYHYDPTKWLIRLLSYFGLTYNLKRFSNNEILKGQYQIKAKKLEKDRQFLEWGPDVATLPEYTMEEVKAKCTGGSKLVVINNFVHDVSEFINEHPGGTKIIDAYVGVDATRAFVKDVYAHSNAARNLLHGLRVGRIAKPAQS
eukprot:TRINITY_DN1285_c0_g1_i3.p1 TRINITY_DN1285_c0_g1~~TRINITY_DN1285_c0_g1_i3.p1  ORF type:complete len:795 (+),score=169.54 TRINITY_DN1285_c0_g1_i3:59-2443(+)